MSDEKFYIFVKKKGQHKFMPMDLQTGQVGMLQYATEFTSFEAADDKRKMLEAIDRHSEFRVSDKQIGRN